MQDYFSLSQLIFNFPHSKKVTFSQNITISDILLQSLSTALVTDIKARSTKVPDVRFPPQYLSKTKCYEVPGK
jgi:hypothetical protein